MSMMKPLVKWATTVQDGARRSRRPSSARSQIATEGVPGPVFVEVPVDLLYPEAIVRMWYEKEAGLGKAKGIGAKALELYIKGHLYRQFRAPAMPEIRSADEAAAAAQRQRRSTRPPQALRSGEEAGDRRRQPDARRRQGSGPARARDRHARRAGVSSPAWRAACSGARTSCSCATTAAQALKEADCVIVCGFPFDFRLGYGRGINKHGTLIAANLSAHELRKNRRPDIAIEMHAGDFLVALAERVGGGAARRAGATGSRRCASARRARRRDREQGARRRASSSIRCTSSRASTRRWPTTRCSSSTAVTSSRPRATSCGRARRCRGSIPACSARSASAAASRSAPRSCGRAGRSGSSGATARARTRSPSSTPTFATASRRSR